MTTIGLRFICCKTKIISADGVSCTENYRGWLESVVKNLFPQWRAVAVAQKFEARKKRLMSGVKKMKVKACWPETNPCEAQSY